jgi:predicted enzyme related to lactoylglutathione lyase
VPVTGFHGLIYTSEPEAVRAIFRDVFGWEHVDAGDGWLIFKLPPAELGVHPADAGYARDFSFMCDDLDATIAELQAKGVEFAGDPENVGYGIAITMLLPGGAEVTLYEPRHPTAIQDAFGSPPP